LSMDNEFNKPKSFVGGLGLLGLGLL